MALKLKEDPRLRARRAWGICLLVLAFLMPVAVYLWGDIGAQMLTDFFEAVDEQAEHINAVVNHHPPVPRGVRLASFSIAVPLAVAVSLFLWGLRLLDPSS